MPARTRRGRRLPTLLLPNMTIAVSQPKASVAASMTVSGPASTSNFGPAIGAAAVRAAAGIKASPAISVFSGTANVNFTQMVPGETGAQMQTRIDNAVSQSTLKVWWPAGEYRPGQELSVRANTEYRFKTGPLRTSADTAIVKGSSVVTGFTQGTGADANKWFKTGQTQNFDATDRVEVDNPPAGNMTEAYFKTGVFLHPVSTRAKVAGTTNCYFLDKATATVWFGFNPASFTIEKSSFLYFIFNIKKSGVTFRGGIFEHSAHTNIQAQTDAGVSPTNFLMEDVESRYGRLKNFHVQGTSIQNRSSNFTLRRCWFHHGGVLNFAMANVNTVLVENVESSFGNFLHYGNRAVADNDEGGDKTFYSQNCTYRGCYLHDNDGAGCWQDTYLNAFIVEQSVIENNFCHGVHYEDSSGATIRYNYFANNGQKGLLPAPYDGSQSASLPTLSGWGGGAIIVSSSSNVESHNNHFYLNDNITLYMRDDTGTPGNGSDFQVTGNNFHDNLVYHTYSNSGSFDFLISYRDSYNAPMCLATGNNRYNFNQYHVRVGGRTNDGSANWFFAPSGTLKTFTTWKQGFSGAIAGGSPASYHDPNSTLVADTTDSGGTGTRDTALIGATYPYTAFRTALGGVAQTAVRTFAVNGNWGSSDYDETRQISAAGMTPVVSMKLNSTPALMASGAQDAALTNIFDGMRGLTKPPVVIYWHECENDAVNQSTQGKADYRAAYVRFSNLAKSLIPSVRVAICFLGSTMPGNASWGPPEDFYPGDAYIDIVMSDHYDKHGTQDDGGPYWAVPGSAAATMAFMFSGAVWAQTRSKPYMFGEMGSARLEAETTGATRTAYLTTMANYARDSTTNIMGYLYYDRGNAYDGSARPNWTISQEPPSMTQFGRFATYGVVP